ncbi:MAG: hypothetical protein AB7E76_09345 [Deferribacterales bacterium]
MLDYDINIQSKKDSKYFSIISFTAIKLIIAILMIIYFEYGLYVVIGYLIFSIESNSFQNHLNTLEANFHFNKVYQNISNKNTFDEATTLEEKINELEERIIELELELDR